MKNLIVLMIACLVLSSGCSNHVAKNSERGLFHITLSAKGKIVKYGRNEVDMYVTDKSGTGVEGAVIGITPWMPEHGHGSMWPSVVTEKGKGRYRAVIPLIMTGHWELKITVRKGSVEDRTVFDFPNVRNES